MDSQRPVDIKKQPAARRQRWGWIVLSILVSLLIFSKIALQSLKTKGWTPYTTTNSGLADNDLNALAIDGQGRVWVGTNGGGLSVLDPDGGWKTYTHANSGLADTDVWALAIDGQGRVWVGTTRGLSVLDPDGSWKTYTHANSGLAENDINALAIDGQGRVWVGTSSGLSVLDPDGSWTTYTHANSGLADTDVWALAIDGQGRVWVGTRGGGLSVLDPDGGWTTYNNANSGLAVYDVWALVIDGQGQVWVGTTRGLSVLDPDGSWTTYTHANSGLAENDINALAIDGQGRVWVGTNGGGLSVLDPDGSWTTYTHANSGLADTDVWALAIDGQRQVWVGTYSGLSVLDPEAAIAPDLRASLNVIPTTIFAILIIFAIVWVVQQLRLRPRAVVAPQPAQRPAAIEAAFPTPTAMLGSSSKGDGLRSLRSMESNGLSGPKMKRVKKSARGVYRWLWCSPLLTIPTLALLLFSDMPISIAVLGSALWHLLLLRQALAKHPFVRWHGWQGLLLAGLRTAFPLVYGLLSYDEEGLALSILILIAIWLVGNIWGQDQVARGDCWLMRVRGQGDGLPLKWSPAAPARPQPSAGPSVARLAKTQREAEVADLLAVFQIGDAASRSKALEQLKSMGEVEVF